MLTAVGTTTPLTAKNDAPLFSQYRRAPESAVFVNQVSVMLSRSERDIRCHVIKRKISGGTHSDAGRDCRDAFLGLMHTATKLGIAFWDYLGARLRTSHSPVVPYLPDLIRCRGQPHDSPHSQMAPNMCANRGWAAS